MNRGDKDALDDFRCASDSVASGFQPPRGWRPDPLAAGGRLGGVSHQPGERPPCSVRVVLLEATGFDTFARPVYVLFTLEEGAKAAVRSGPQESPSS
jgi:hypothetical protein